MVNPYESPDSPTSSSGYDWSYITKELVKWCLLTMPIGLLVGAVWVAGMFLVKLIANSLFGMDIR